MSVGMSDADWEAQDAFGMPGDMSSRGAKHFGKDKRTKWRAFAKLADHFEAGRRLDNAR